MNDDLIQRVNELIGEELGESLSDEESRELIALREGGATQDDVEAWLIAHVPDYKEIVEDNVIIAVNEQTENVET